VIYSCHYKAEKLAQGEQAKLYLIILHNIRNKLYLDNKNQLNFAMNRKNLMLPESYTTKRNIGKACSP
jgi:hypothetical protein